MIVSHKEHGTMAEDELAKMVIPEIPPEEKILKEGVLRSIELKKKTPIVFHYKYAITEKGIWTRNEKRLLNKSKTVFAAFADLDDYEVIAHKMGECCAFNRKKLLPMIMQN